MHVDRGVGSGMLILFLHFCFSTGPPFPFCWCCEVLLHPPLHCCAGGISKWEPKSGPWIGGKGGAFHPLQVFSRRQGAATIRVVQFDS